MPLSETESIRAQAHEPVPNEENTIAGGSVPTGYATWLESDAPVAFEESLEGESVARSTVPIIVRAFDSDHEPRIVDIAEIPRLINDDRNFVWVDLSEYSEDDLRRVADLAGIHGRVIRLALSPWQRPRVDVFKSHFFVCVTLAERGQDERRLHAHELDLIVSNNILISAHKQPLSFGTRIVSRAQTDPELVRLDAAFMLYIVLDQLLEHHETVLERIKGEIEELQVRAVSDSSDRFLQDLVEFKRVNFALTQLVEHHRTVFDAFLRPDFPFVSGDEVEDYFHMLGARLARLMDLLESSRAEVNSAFDIYISHQTHRTNVQMKMLTIVATLLLPANVIIAFFGTQFAGLPLYTPRAFVVMLAAIAVTTVFILAFYRRHGML